MAIATFFLLVVIITSIHFRIILYPYGRKTDQFKTFCDDPEGFLQVSARFTTEFKLFYFNSQLVFKQVNASSNTELKFSASRVSKHGTVILSLPYKLFYMDLTIHMDIQSNPGPLVNGNRCTLCPVTVGKPILNIHANERRTYSRNQLLNLRSKYTISEDLFHFLKAERILKTHRTRGGLLSRSEANKFHIPVLVRSDRKKV